MGTHWTTFRSLNAFYSFPLPNCACWPSPYNVPNAKVLPVNTQHSRLSVRPPNEKVKKYTISAFQRLRTYGKADMSTIKTNIPISQIYAILTYLQMQSIPVQLNWVGLSIAVYPLSKFFLVFLILITHLPPCSPNFGESPREPCVHSDMASETVPIKITSNNLTAKINSHFFHSTSFLIFGCVSFTHLFNIYWVPTMF